MKAKKKIRDVVYHVIVFGIGILMIYPLIWMFMSSFKETKTIFQTAGSLIPNPFTLDNYINGLKGFAKVPFLVFFKNSLFISVVATIGTVISSAVVAYGFARFDFKGKKILFAAMLLSMMLPAQVLMIDLGISSGSKVTIITEDGFAFKDFLGTGELAAYEDWRLPAAERAVDLASRLSIDQSNTQVPAVHGSLT